jgi:hypothetical protein
MELRMADPFRAFPEPQTVALRRICLARAAVCLSALTSTAVLLSKVMPAVIGGFN